MKVFKITTGFVTQTWDTELKKWISQEFTCGDECEYETEHQNDEGDWLDDKGQPIDDVSDLICGEVDLPYDMVQPDQSTPLQNEIRRQFFARHTSQFEEAGGTDTKLYFYHRLMDFTVEATLEWGELVVRRL
jgi:hypothetical protein